MKQRSAGGFSLIEVLVAMVLLAAVVIPTCSSLVMSFEMNSKTDEMMQAQLAVSSAVETLMAEGITEETQEKASEKFPDVEITFTDKGNYFEVKVEDEAKLVSVTTNIRKTISPTETTEGGADA